MNKKEIIGQKKSVRLRYAVKKFMKYDWDITAIERFTTWEHAYIVTLKYQKSLQWLVVFLPPNKEPYADFA